jgi:uncharacterized protein YjbI with pentapeptide repeats
VPPAKKQSTQSPHLDFRPPNDLTDADAELLKARELHEGERFSDADLSEYDLTGAVFSECVFSGVTFTEAELRGVKFAESVIESSFAPVLFAARTTWREVHIENPRWGSADLFDSELDRIRIHGGKIDFLNLRGAKLNDVLIEDCTIAELDLGGIRGTRIALSNCRIGTLDLTHAAATHLDLRTSEFSVAKGLDGLRGATIDELQLSLLAPLLATELGITVE